MEKKVLGSAGSNRVGRVTVTTAIFFFGLIDGLYVTRSHERVHKSRCPLSSNGSKTAVRVYLGEIEIFTAQCSSFISTPPCSLLLIEIDL